MEVLLLDIEAELAIWEEGQVVWSEEAFPVAELAYRLALWLRSPAAGAEDFELDDAGGAWADPDRGHRWGLADRLLSHA